ncbi:SET and MYND domain-containing protein 4-like [Oppia nitens]|uniref:SET and MYND domain-containing protein 4-like n=1 Tax=Oppia nitens TaxID=1686743 RepID=UPI0023DAC3D4|nr:SET and MYND domain-containing protein 4-like [Oppia nitens]
MDHLIDMDCDFVSTPEFELLENSKQRVDYVFSKVLSIKTSIKKVNKLLTKCKNKNQKSVTKSQEYRRQGNKFFDHKNYEFALHYYSKSVLCAPHPSKTASDLQSANELSYAYSGRSLVFLKMGLHDNALHDIDCALHLSVHTMPFLTRLLFIRHRVKCLCKMKRYGDAFQTITSMIQLMPSLPIYNHLVAYLIKQSNLIRDRVNEDLEEDEEFQTEYEVVWDYCQNIDHYMCHKLELYETPESGRRFKTTANLQKQSIVMLEKAMSCVLFNTHWETHCQNCCKNIGYKHWSCPQCSQVVFCNEKCAKEAKFHKYECRIMDVLSAIGTNYHILFRIILLVGPQLAIELVGNKSKQFNIFSANDSSAIDFLKFLQLSDHRHQYSLKIKAKSIQRAIQMALVFNNFDEFKTSNESTVEYLKQLASTLDILNYKICVNAFGMYEKMNDKQIFRGNHIGNGICFMTSFFNHSCDANAFWQFNGRYITVATQRDINANEDITVCYGPNYTDMSFDERQEFLKNNYFFECKCGVCSDEKAKSLSKSQPKEISYFGLKGDTSEC